MHSDKIMTNRLINIYMAVFVSLVVFQIVILRADIINSFQEQDFLWFIPGVLGEIKGISLVQLFGYFLRPWPVWWGVPSLKIYITFIISVFGPLARNFIFTSLLFHVISSVLMFILIRQMRLGARIGFLAACFYLTFFAQFHTYMWPAAFQHLVVVFFILLIMNLYLKTDSLLSSGLKYRRWFVLTLAVNLFASICRPSILILPAIILSHIILSAKNESDRLKKYNIWLPLFFMYLLYPLFIFAIGDPRVFMFFARFDIPVLFKFLIMFSLGVVFLIVLRLFLSFKKVNFKAIGLALAGFGAFGFLILLFISGLNKFLIPYNLLLPFVGSISSFLHPLESALRFDSARPYYFLPFQLDAFNFMVALVILAIFIKKFIGNNRELMIFAVWYIISLGYIYLRNPLLSRYFIYVSPILCLVFSCVFDFVFTSFLGYIKLKKIMSEVLILVGLFAICIPNVLAIKLALFRGRAVNTFMTYDYIRAANTIKNDLFKKYTQKDLRGKILCVNNVIPIECTAVVIDKHPYADSENYNLKFVFMKVFKNTDIKIKINTVTQKDEANSLVYSFNSDRVDNARGYNLDVFSGLFSDAQEKMKSGRYQEAMALFEKTVKERPFLLKYVLPGMKFEDLTWITNTQDMRSWLNQIECFYNVDASGEELRKIKYVSAIMNKEIEDYTQSLFFLAYLKYVSGESVESKRWFSEIRYFEKDYRGLSSRLSQLPAVKSDPAMASFLGNFSDFSLYARDDDYLNRYKFENFIYRLINS